MICHSKIKKGVNTPFFYLTYIYIYKINDIMNAKEKQIVENYIYKIVKKTINENREMLSEGNQSERKRGIVMKWLNGKTINQTEIMRQLWHPQKNEEDGKRSLFFKKLHGDLNDSGYAYEFTDEEINSLYKIKSSGIDE